MNPADQPVRPSIGLPPEQFAAAFPFHLGVGQDLTLLQVGRSLQRICPDVVPGARLGAVFRSVQPDEPWSFARLVENHQQFFLLVHPGSGLQLRGEFVVLPGGQTLLFLGSPWFTEAGEIAERGLGFEDFAIHDSVVDLLQVLQTRELALADAKKLLAKLSSQRAELRAANDRLRQQEAETHKLALIAARTDNAVVLTDPAGRTVWVNEGFTRLTGYTLEEMLGKKPGAVLQGPGTDPATVRHLGDHLRRNEGCRVEILNYHKDGHSYWLATEVQPIHDEQGRVTNFMAIESDITERRAADEALRKAKEAAEAANHAKSDFLAMMSHEIRTPMNGIIGMTNLLLDSPLGELQREFASTVSRSGEALLEIINDILDFSKIEAGQLRLELSHFELRPLLAGVLELLQTRAQEKGLALTMDIAADVPAGLRSDDGRLRQVLLNLTGNSLKFTKHGGVTVRVRVLGKPEVRVRLRFEIQDSGIGISAADQAALFQPFTQVNMAETRKQGGTGLGLAISRRIVELLGGQIGVRSTLGVGSVFWFEIEAEIGQVIEATFPAPQASGFMAGAHLAPPQGKPGPAVPLRILLAEDHDTNRRLALLMLEKLGYRADVAGNGQEAVEAWERFDYDVILMDCQMPELDGFEATRQIRRRAAARPATKRIPARIIALTANALSGDRERCLAAGMDAYLSKPVRLEALAAALADAGERLAQQPRPSGANPSPLPSPQAPLASPPSPNAVERSLAELEREFGAAAALELLTSFLKDSPPRLTGLRQLAAKADGPTLGCSAHALAGSCGIFGLETMRRLGLQLEDIAPAGESPERESLMAALEREFASIQPRMEELRRHLVDSATTESAKEEL